MTLSHNSGKSAGDTISKDSFGPVAIGKLSAALASQTLKSRGPAISALISQWPAIAGPSLSSYTCPEKLSRGASEKFGKGDGRNNLGGHLLVKVDPSRALDLQYMMPQLVERVNSALGYKAVASIRMMQGVISKPAPKRPAVPAVPNASAPSAGASRLEQALSKMANGIKGRTTVTSA